MSLAMGARCHMVRLCYMQIASPKLVGKHTYMHTSLPTHTHTHTHAHKPPNTHTHTHTCTQASQHTHTHTHTHTCTQALQHTHTHTHTHTKIHTGLSTRTCTHTCTQASQQTHTDTKPRMRKRVYECVMCAVHIVWVLCMHLLLCVSVRFWFVCVPRNQGRCHVPGVHILIHNCTNIKI
jgi:hypothetical protein